MSDSYHIPVLLQECIKNLVTNPNGVYADGTAGGGGHTQKILGAVSELGYVFAFDADKKAVEYVNELLARTQRKNYSVHQKYFSEAVNYLEEQGVKLDGVLLDLGVSSRQLDSSQIGLSFRQDMPLDMRFRQEDSRESASMFLNRAKPEEIADVLRRYGEEPAAWKLAQAIARQAKLKPLFSTLDLKNIIEDAIPQPFVIKTLTRVFQSLRIYVNNEMNELEQGLVGFMKLLKNGGRIVVLTYHSLEDRIVKNFFREEEKDCICPKDFPECRCSKEQRLKIITRKPILPSNDEVLINNRARSAKLRVAERV